MSLPFPPLDHWLCTPRLDESEPENEDACCCSDGIHGSDCLEFEPPTAESLRGDS